MAVQVRLVLDCVRTSDKVPDNRYLEGHEWSPVWQQQNSISVREVIYWALCAACRLEGSWPLQAVDRRSVHGSHKSTQNCEHLCRTVDIYSPLTIIMSYRSPSLLDWVPEMHSYGFSARPFLTGVFFSVKVLKFLYRIQVICSEKVLEYLMLRESSCTRYAVYWCRNYCHPCHYHEEMYP